MKTIIGERPEVPRPAQLNLFEEPVHVETVKNSTDSTVSVTTNDDDLRIRSPTGGAPIVTKDLLNESSQLLASSLLRKSRELVKKSREKKLE